MNQNEPEGILYLCISETFNPGAESAGEYLRRQANHLAKMADRLDAGGDQIISTVIEGDWRVGPYFEITKELLENEITKELLENETIELIDQGEDPDLHLRNSVIDWRVQNAFGDGQNEEMAASGWQWFGKNVYKMTRDELVEELGYASYEKWCEEHPVDGSAWEPERPVMLTEGGYDPRKTELREELGPLQQRVADLGIEFLEHMPEDLPEGGTSITSIDYRTVHDFDGFFKGFDESAIPARPYNGVIRYRRGVITSEWRYTIEEPDTIGTCKVMYFIHPDTSDLVITAVPCAGFPKVWSFKRDEVHDQYSDFVFKTVRAWEGARRMSIWVWDDAESAWQGEGE